MTEQEITAFAKADATEAFNDAKPRHRGRLSRQWEASTGLIEALGAEATARRFGVAYASTEWDRTLNTYDVAYRQQWDQLVHISNAGATTSLVRLSLTLSKDQAIDLSLKLWHVTSIVEIGDSWYAYRGEGKVDRGYLSPTCFKVLCRDRAGVWRTL